MTSQDVALCCGLFAGFCLGTLCMGALAETELNSHVKYEAVARAYTETHNADLQVFDLRCDTEWQRDADTVSCFVDYQYTSLPLWCDLAGCVVRHE